MKKVIMKISVTHFTWIIVAILLSPIISSCSQERQGNYTLTNTGSIAFKLDSDTKNDMFSYCLYEDSDKTYFTFQNRNSNDILFYDMDDQELKFKISPFIEGNNGVGLISGYYIHNLDSIYLTNMDIKEMSLINRNCIVLDKYSYEYDKDSTELSLFYISGALHKPAQQIGRKLYLYSGPNRYVEKDPVSIIFNMDTHEFQSLPFYYPNYPGSDIKLKKYGLEDTFSRCFDGSQFIYSFYYDENIYVADPSHKTIQKIKIKSQYFNKVQLPDELKAQAEDFCVNAWYGNLLFDPYRNVYYRIAYPPATSLRKDIRPMELYQYGRKNFSIIILDKDFNILGETLFPDYTYNSWIIFVGKDGLYISDSHYLNPDFSDDVLSFQKFELKAFQ